MSFGGQIPGKRNDGWLHRAVRLHYRAVDRSGVGGSRRRACGELSPMSIIPIGSVGDRSWSGGGPPADLIRSG